MAITHTPSEPQPALAVSSESGSRLLICDLKTIWTAWRRRRDYRRDVKRLLRVGPHMIEDIGLTLEEASREAVRPFWRA